MDRVNTYTLTDQLLKVCERTDISHMKSLHAFFDPCCGLNVQHSFIALMSFYCSCSIRRFLD